MREVSLVKPFLPRLAGHETISSVGKRMYDTNVGLMIGIAALHAVNQMLKHRKEYMAWLDGEEKENQT